MPAAIMQRLSDQTRAAIMVPDAVATLQAAGTQPVGSDAARFGDFLRAEIARWAEVARARNISVE
jgi:tripartite-type tricarboxylate transporter receptor subunit TctC